MRYENSPARLPAPYCILARLRAQAYTRDQPRWALDAAARAMGEAWNRVGIIARQ